MIIQCDLGSVDGDLIACARNRIYDLKAKADKYQTTHVLFVIHLSHQVVNSSFVGFQGDPWMSSHIDDLNTTTEDTVSASDAFGLSISELFRGVSYTDDLDHIQTSDVASSDSSDRWVYNVSRNEGVEDLTIAPLFVEDIETEDLFIEDETGIFFYGLHHKSSMFAMYTELTMDSQRTEEKASVFQPPVTRRVPLYRRLHGCIQAAASKVKDFTAKRCTKRVEILVNLIPKNFTEDLGKIEFV